jgi:predicted kinase
MKKIKLLYGVIEIIKRIMDSTEMYDPEKRYNKTYFAEYYGVGIPTINKWIDIFCRGISSNELTRESLSKNQWRKILNELGQCDKRVLKPMNRNELAVKLGLRKEFGVNKSLQLVDQVLLMNIGQKAKKLKKFPPKIISDILVKELDIEPIKALHRQDNPSERAIKMYLDKVALDIDNLPYQEMRHTANVFTKFMERDVEAEKVVENVDFYDIEEKHSPFLGLVIGNVGTGKSTFTEHLKERDLEIISADSFEDKYKSKEQIQKDISKAVERAISKGGNVLFDGNLQTKLSRQFFVYIAKQAKYKVVVFDFGEGNESTLGRRLEEPKGETKEFWERVHKKNLELHEPVEADKEFIDLVEDKRNC